MKGPPFHGCKKKDWSSFRVSMYFRKKGLPLHTPQYSKDATQFVKLSNDGKMCEAKAPTSPTPKPQTLHRGTEIATELQGICQGNPASPGCILRSILGSCSWTLCGLHSNPDASFPTQTSTLEKEAESLIGVSPKLKV